MDGVSATEQSSPGRCADGLSVVVVENNAGVCQCINVGSHELFGPVKTNVIPTLKFHTKIHFWRQSKLDFDSCVYFSFFFAHDSL